ncbi:MAG: Trk system potassium transporter TrkA [Candidatus Gastranaerophilales bacterium]|nr:Trk system potassium transporter TrkA [Candidatus Gastranaerophilales bacterium]
MKIVISGANNRALLIATSLFEDHDVVLIDDTENLGDDFNNLDIEVVEGNASDIKILKENHLDEADVFIACTDSDEANIVSCIMMKSVSQARTVCFIRQESYYDSLNAVKNSRFNRDIFADYVIRPEELLTQELFRIITVPSATHVENFAKGKARMLEYPIKSTSPIANKKIRDCNFPPEVLIVGITRNGELSLPTGDTQLLEGDKVIFMGAVKSLDILAANVFREDIKIDSVTIIGGGTVGLMLAQTLEEADIHCKVFEINMKRCEYISENLKKSLVINGDGTDVQLLLNEGVEDSDVLVCVTDNDEKNLLCSLLAKQSGVKKVISRVSKAVNVNLFEKVGIDVAISQNEAAMHEIYNHLIVPDISILATVESGQGEIMELSLPINFKQRKIMDLKLPYKAVIAIVERRNRVIIPKGDTLVFPQDNLIIFTMQETSAAIQKYLFSC